MRLNHYLLNSLRKIAGNLKLTVIVVGIALSFWAANFAFVQDVWAKEMPAIGKVRIWPTNNTIFLVNQRFDLRIENTIPAKTAPTLQALTINGKDYTKEFQQQIAKQLALPGGKLEVGLPADPNLFGQSWRNFTFEQPGSYEVIATLKADNISVIAKNTYKVQRFELTGEVNKIILAIGDGMGNPLRTAGRIMAYGFQDGKSKAHLSMESMTELGLVSTSSLDSIIPDSANTAIALTSGAKTINGSLGAFPDNTPSNPLDNPRIETLPQYMKRLYGWGIGFATTAFGVDATPASTFANLVSRRQYDAIAQQLLDYFEDGYSLPKTGFKGLAELSQPVDVALAPGARYFLPKSKIADFKDKVSRKDDKNLVEIAKGKGYSIATDVDTLLAAPNNKPLLGLFLGDFRPKSALGAQNIPSVLDIMIARGKATIDGRGAESLKPPIPKEFAKIPTLPEMTKKAISVLNTVSPKGWILLVESSQTDKLAHSIDTDRVLYEVLTLDKSVAIAREFAQQDGKTLVLVTSDHAQGQTVAGTVDTLAIKEKRVDLKDALHAFENAGFPTYSDLDNNGYPDEANPNIKLVLGVSARPAFRTNFLTDDLNLNPSVENDGSTVNPEREPDGLLLTADLERKETIANHTADDVVLNAEGPGSALFRGYLDNVEVFQRMAAAISGAKERAELPKLLE
ncbi:alkaline phosphatase [Tumidithrix elongata RA019]|uniref:Alkaline phosphatase n=1 Tax=Tumidithrix elongata BACA0141 TaxID=2716417 RepID=A0AAW9PXI9_9CYAN|nr:alkaline phosphatase [Tumidithrix elongata RA019]